MPRRVHHPTPLQPGLLDLDVAEAHHLRDVLRLTTGDAIELFDDAGNVGHATIAGASTSHVRVFVESIEHVSRQPGTLIIASAVPKGDRAEWMIEKLSELGVDRFIPLATARSVVHPEGKNKRDRWMRIATEAAKQSRRSGVMTIDELLPVDKAIAGATAASWTLAPGGDASLIDVARDATTFEFTLFIGPEGGWTVDELARFSSAKIASARLTSTVLRIETAAILGAGVLSSIRGAAVEH